jgi:hypothetical protein
VCYWERPGVLKHQPSPARQPHALFYREKTGECRAYLHNQTTRTVYALRSGQWVAIGKVFNDIGDIQMFEGQDWLP